jgi:hypothetical protein
VSNPDAGSGKQAAGSRPPWGKGNNKLIQVTGSGKLIFADAMEAAGAAFSFCTRLALRYHIHDSLTAWRPVAQTIFDRGLYSQPIYSLCNMS